MDVNATTTSAEVKSEGLSKTKRTYVIGVVDTTGMKSVNANRKRRWDQPPDIEGDHSPPKVRGVDGESSQPDAKQYSVVCEEDQDITEDYDSQYEECVGSKKVVADSSLEEPSLEEVNSTPVSEAKITEDANESLMDSKMECSEEPSLVDKVKPDNLPPLPTVECPPNLPAPIEGSTDHAKVSIVNVKDNVNQEPKIEVKTDIQVEEKIVAKPNEAVSVTGIISDSLKQIQFCYDEDSNSTEESEVETKVIDGNKTDVEILAKEEDVNSNNQLPEQRASASATVDPSEQDTRRSLTPVLSEEQDEQLVAETVISQEEPNAVVECKTDTDIEFDSHSIADTREEVHDAELTNAVNEPVREKKSCSVESSEFNKGSGVHDSLVDGEGNDHDKIASSLGEHEIRRNLTVDSANVPEAHDSPVLSEDNVQVKITSSLSENAETSESTEDSVIAGLHDSVVVSKDQVEIPSSLGDGEHEIRREPTEDSVNEPKVQCQSSLEQELEKKLSDDENTTPATHASDELLSEIKEDSVSSAQSNVVKDGASVSCNEISSKTGDFQQPDNEFSCQENSSVGDDTMKETEGVYKSNSTKPVDDSMVCDSEPSLSKDSKMSMDESSDKYSIVIDDKVSGKGVGQNNLVSMDNSQNCVGFDELNNTEKVTSKSADHDLQCPDTEEELKANSSEVTMHFASFRTPENAADTTPERVIENVDDESFKALDVLPPENPDKEEKDVQFQEPISSMDGNTMEMLDSLVRRSSEDDPSRVQLGEGILSEDSLINEINQLPDKEDDEKQIEPDHEGTSEALVESISPNDHESTSKDEVDTGESKKTIVEVTPEAFENVDLAATANPSHSEKIGIVSGDVKCKPGDQRNVDKPEGGMSVEDELSQGGEEESKNMNVSSENIIEVIFGSKQENNIHTIGSMERDGDSKATEKNDKDSKIAENSLVDDVELKTCSDSNDARKSVDDSKLQLNNEEIEIDNTEIVMVDPTKPLSGEDSDNDADERPSNKRTSATKEAKACLSLSPKADVTPSDDGDVPPSNKSADLSIQPKPKSKDVEVEELMEVEESNMPGTKMNKTVIDEPMDVDEKSEMRSAVSDDNTATMKAKNEEKPAPMNEVREPSVPVLIIKKQALSSKKDGDKKTMETLLTCSPKSTDNLVSDTAPTPSQKKVHNEALQIDTTSESTAASFSPKHSPITLRIYKDNLTVKTDLDSPKRNKSPMSSEFKSELSPKLRSPGVSENLSPQNKPLEFTLKIAKDAHTNFPKATMSPKNVSSPNSVWKSEVQITDSPTVNNKEIQETKSVPQSTPTRGRGRGRGRGATPKRGAPGRGRRGGFRGRISSGVDETSKTSLEATEASSSSMGIADVIIKQEVLTEDEKSDGSSVGVPIQMHDMYKKVIKKEADGNATPDKSIHSEVVTPRMIDTPIVKKRGRPRKSIQTPIVVPEEIVTVKNEPMTPGEALTPVVEIADGDDGSSSTGRPKRTCRGRTKPIVVKKRKPRGGGAVGAGVPRGASTPLPPIEIKEENATPTAIVPTTAEATTPESTTLPTVTPSPPTDKSGVTPTPPARGRGGFKRPTPDRNTLSEKELAELQKIEAKKEKLRLDRIAKYEAKKAKKLAKKLKDEERRKRLAREKAEKAEAAAPQVFEEETRMSAPDSSSIGQTPGQPRFLTGDTLLDESQNSISTPGDTNKGNKKGRMEICITDMDCLVKEVRVDELAEYQWQGSELYMIQEQVSLYLGVKSFKRKYPGLKRRPVEAEERTFLEDSGLVPKSMCDLGLTAVGSAEILDIMFQDFPEKYEEFRKHVRDKQAREASFKQKAAIGLQRKDGTKVEPREQALEAVAAWNANLNRERREERRCALDLQTFTVHYPKLERENMKKHVPKVGLYPVAVIPGQFCDHYKKYTPNELMYFPVNTVLYGPLRPNERQKDNGSEDGSGSESSSSSSSSSSSGESSSESESEGDEPAKCKMCNGTKKRNKDSIPEVLLTCVQCKACYHPTCKEFTPEMIIHLTKYEWQCTACKKCSKCRDPNLKDRIMCCQLCDRGYHLSCIGLKKMPEGRWHCTICAYCSSCGSRNPGGSDWQHEFKKGEKGIKIYQRTLCTPCFKLWRKGKYCQLCSKCHSMKPEEDPNLIQCNSCDRWLHKECYGSKYGLTNKLMSTSSIQCDFCVERITLGTQGLSRSLIKV